MPLLDRTEDAVLFRTPAGDLTAAAFLSAADRLAAELPDAPFLVNLCRERHRFALAFAAALLRGQVTLLSGERTDSGLRALGERFPGARSIADDRTIGGPLPHHHLDEPSLVRPARALAIPVIEANQPAAIVFTSGSTGEPAGHRKSWGALADRSGAAGLRFDMDVRTPVSIVGTVPPQHMYGFETTVLLPLHAAASSWCGRVFYPDDVRAALEALPAPRLLVTTPLQLRALLQAAIPLPPLAAIVSATAPLDAALASEAEGRLGAQVLEIFGATEVGSIASRRTLDGETWTAYHGVHLVAGPDGVLIAAPHAEIWPLNDAIERLDDTRFRLAGRRTDIVKLAGRRASLEGLNRVLAGVEGVVDGVFVAPDDLGQRSSTRLLAFAVAPGRSAEEILAALRAVIDPIFLPRRIVLLDTLPRNELGKLPREALVSLCGQT